MHKGEDHGVHTTHKHIKSHARYLFIPIFDQVPGLIEIINHHNYYSSMIFSSSSERGLVAPQTEELFKYERYHVGAAYLW